MSTFSQFVGGAPVAAAEYTTGTGTHTWSAAANIARVTMVGGGSGGSRPDTTATGGGGGGAGQTLVAWVLKPGAGTTAYEIGAGGTGASSNDSLGTDRKSVG